MESREDCLTGRNNSRDWERFTSTKESKVNGLERRVYNNSFLPSPSVTTVQYYKVPYGSRAYTRYFKSTFIIIFFFFYVLVCTQPTTCQYRYVEGYYYYYGNPQQSGNLLMHQTTNAFYGKHQ